MDHLITDPADDLVRSFPHHRKERRIHFDDSKVSVMDRDGIGDGIECRLPVKEDFSGFGGPPFPIHGAEGCHIMISRRQDPFEIPHGTIRRQKLHDFLKLWKSKKTGAGPR
jgi:hypothetical protein